MINNTIAHFVDYQTHTMNKSNDIIAHYKYCLLKFYERLLVYKGVIKIGFNQVSIEDINRFIAHLRTTPILYGPNKGSLRGNNTICEYSKSLRVFFRWWKSLGNTGLNREAIPKLQKDRKRLDMCKDEEYYIFRQAPLRYEEKEIIGLRNQLLIDIPYYTGLRRSEILRCTFENFKSPTNQFEILGKGGYIDGVCFNNKIKNKVLDYEHKLKEFTKIRPIENDLIFVSLNNRTRGKVICPKYVNIVFVKYSEKLMKDGKLSRRISPHMERHSFATNCVLKGVSQQGTTRIMRHRDPKTTERYYHMDNKWLKSEYDKLGNSL